MSEIRKANATKQKLDSCHASGVIVAEERNKWIDSTSIERDKNKVLVKKNKSIAQKRDNWRIAGLVALAISLAEIIKR